MYRKQAVAARGKSLHGRVILRSPPGWWVICALLVSVLGLIIFGLLSLSIEQIPLGQWILAQFSAPSP